MRGASLRQSTFSRLSVVRTSVTARWQRVGPYLLTIASLVVALIHRANGFTSHSLFFDDAWAALPSHVSAGTALQMSVSTPLWTMAERWWILLNPHSTSWSQIPPYACGAIASVLVFPLLRRFGASRWAAAIGTSLLALSPMITTYSTRVKPYTAEMLLAICLYFLAERARRNRTRRSLMLLSLVSIASFAVSFAMLSTVATLWLVITWQGRRETSSRTRALIVGAVTAAVLAAVAAPYVINRPPSLGDNWVNRGYMFGYDSAHRFVHNLIQIFAGFTHTFVNYGFDSRFADGENYPAVCVVATVTLVLTVLVIWRVRRLDIAMRDALAPVAWVVPVSFLAAVVDAFPFGDGRTDIVFYPALAVVLVLVLQDALRQLVVARGWSWRRVSTVVAIVAVITGVNVFWRRPALYPQIDVRNLYAMIQKAWQPGDVIVVPAFVTYTWADAGLTPWHVVVGDAKQWPQGFRVVSDDPRVIFPVNWTGFDPQLKTLRQHHPRVWYVGYTLGAWNPYEVKGKFVAGIPMSNYTLGTLQAYGWRTSWFPSYSLNTYATPLTYQPNKPASPF